VNAGVVFTHPLFSHPLGGEGFTFSSPVEFSSVVILQ